MQAASTLPLLVAGVLALHFAIIAFVIGGVVVVAWGNAKQWRWVNAPWFRVTHLAAISIIVAEAWLGVVCPFTTLENWLRAQAGMSTYERGFIEHWLERLIYYDGPAWVFLVAYALFGALVLATWWYFPPRFRHRAE
jgi:polyferredoxin